MRVWSADWTTSNLLIQGTPSPQKDYFKMQTSLGFDERLFIRCRWLTLIPALTRIVGNWKPICSYLVQEFPKVAKYEKKKRSFNKIKQGKDILSYLDAIPYQCEASIRWNRCHFPTSGTGHPCTLWWMPPFGKKTDAAILEIWIAEASSKKNSAGRCTEYRPSVI